MLALFRRAPGPVADAVRALPMATPEAPDSVVRTLSKQASVMGREAAEVRGAIDDSLKTATAQVQAIQGLARSLQEVVAGQGAIEDQTRLGLSAVDGARAAVQAVGGEVKTIVATLREVSDAANQITQIALQTRLVAFNATVEAKRAGEAGRGFGVVADAVKDLASRVEASSKQIMGTVAALDARIEALARETVADGAQATAESQVHSALQRMSNTVAHIHTAAGQSREVCSQLESRMGTIEGDMQGTQRTLDATLMRTETFLSISEQLIEIAAESGVETEDTLYIEGVKQAAAELSQLLEHAVDNGSIGLQDLFDEQYRPIEGSNPAQHNTRFAPLADRLFPQVQQKWLALSDKVVFCIAADRNGYIACHNSQYNQPQRAGDPLWNAAHCRNRRIFNDRTGLASGRNKRPFLLQTYRRDMGGGQFVVMKEAAAPIVVAGRHWGGVRLAFKF